MSDLTDEEIEKLFAEKRFTFRRCSTCGIVIGGFQNSNEWVSELARHNIDFHMTVQTPKMRDFEAPLV